MFHFTAFTLLFERQRGVKSVKENGKNPSSRTSNSSRPPLLRHQQLISVTRAFCVRFKMAVAQYSGWTRCRHNGT